MQIKRSQEVPQAPVNMEGAAGCQVQILVGSDEHAPNFVMRQFEVAPGGHTPHHQHDYEHEILVLKGTGYFKSDDGDRPYKSGDVVFIPSMEMHQVVNSGDSPSEFICMIPAPECCAI